MDRFDSILLRIKERPGVYLGKPSLKRLSAFLGGYLICMHDITKDRTIDFYPGFQDYIQQRYRITSTQGWDKIIDFFCIKDEEAFYRFFEHLDEFLEQQGKPKLGEENQLPPD